MWTRINVLLRCRNCSEAFPVWTEALSVIQFATLPFDLKRSFTKRRFRCDFCSDKSVQTWFGPFQKPIRYTTFHFQAMFTLHRIVKRSVAESVPDIASVHIRNAAFEAFSAPEQYCSAPLLKVEHSVSDRFLKRSESSLNTFIGPEIATEPRFGKWLFQIKRQRCKLYDG